jgi:hypothetical protein
MYSFFYSKNTNKRMCVMRGRRLLFMSALVAMLTLVMAAPVFAGSPHFVGRISIESDGNTLTVSGKEAGLGNETQVHIEVTAEAQCVNPGGQEPNADNKDSFSAEGDFPVQNGKANFTLVLEADITPNCTPPMTIVWTNVVVSDTEHGVSATFPGPF